MVKRKLHCIQELKERKQDTALDPLDQSIEACIEDTHQHAAEPQEHEQANYVTEHVCKDDCTEPHEQEQADYRIDAEHVHDHDTYKTANRRNR